MARTIITKEIEVITCDICGKESDIITKCRVCGKDICNNCRMWDQCEECWEDNCSYAVIHSKIIDEEFYGGRSYTVTKINYESDGKWKDLLSRFKNKRVKITIEEFPKHEELIGITDFDLSILQVQKQIEGNKTFKMFGECNKNETTRFTKTPSIRT